MANAVATTLTVAALGAGEEPEKTNDDEAGEQEVEIVVVTGTRLRLPPSQLASPVVVMDAQALADTGAANIEEVLARLPQNFNGGTETGGAGRLQLPSTAQFNGTDNVFGASTVNLRGAGNQHTLVLVNGQRLGSSGIIGGYSDVSSIPLEMIDRVEIQLDGASAVYGADAIGGVVNIILKEDYASVTAKLRYSGYTRGGSERYNASLAGTWPWSTGSMTGTLTHFRRTHLAVSDAPGLKDILDRAGRFTDVGNISGFRAARLDSLSELAEEDVFEVPIPEGQDGTGLTLEDFLDIGDPTSSDALQAGNRTMLPERRRSSFNLALRQELTAGIQVKASLSYHPNESVTVDAARAINTSVDADHPLNPFGQRVEVHRSSADLRPKTVRGENDRWTWTTNLEGELSEWDWSVRTNHTVEEAKTRTLDEVSEARLGAAVNDGTLNVLGESLAGSNPPEAIAALTIPLQTFDTVNGNHGVEVLLRRGFDLTRAGTMRVVFGGSWRESRLEYSGMHDPDSRTFLVRPESGLGSFPRDTSELADSDVNLEGIEGVVTLDDDSGTIAKQRRFASLFAEAHLPVLAERPLIHTLSFQAALRHEDADDYGTSRTWSAGAVWEPNPQVRLRARRGTSFSAPALSRSSLPTSLSTGRLFISVSPFEFLWGRSVVRGGNSALLPETATTSSYGLEFRPELVENLRLQLNYSEADHRNKIDGITPFIAGELFLYTPANETRYPGVYRYDEEKDCGGVSEDRVRQCQFIGTDARAINIGTQLIATYDLILDYRMDTRFGEFSATANVTRYARYRRLDGPEEVEVDLVGVVGGVPVHSQRGQLAWERGALRVALNLSHRQRTSHDFKLSSEVEDCGIWNTGGEDWWCTRTFFKNPVVADVVVRWSGDNLFGVGLQVVAGMNNIGGKQTKKEVITPDGAAVVGGTENLLSSSMLETAGKEFYVQATVTF